MPFGEKLVRKIYGEEKEERLDAPDFEGTLREPSLPPSEFSELTNSEIWARFDRRVHQEDPNTPSIFRED